MDLALAIEVLVPTARYGGSTNENSRGTLEALDWTDRRPKPKWEELTAVEMGPERHLVAKSVVIQRLTDE